ncbi:MerR family transcriptional regulator [Candidatus Latescibacterota bacterium]
MKDKADIYSTLDVVKILGISRGRIREWTDEGFITPSTPSAGQGKRNGFSRWDLYGIELFRRIIEKGYSRKNATKYYVEWGMHRKFASKENAKIFYFRQTAQIEGPEGFNPDGEEYGYRKAPLEISGILSSFNIEKITDKIENPKTEVEKFFNTNAEDEWEWEDIVIINTAKIIREVDKMIDKYENR